MDVCCYGHSNTLLASSLDAARGASHFLWFEPVLRFRVSPRFRVVGLQSGLGRFGMGRSEGGFGRLANGGRAAQAMAIPEPHRRHRSEAVAACIRNCAANADRMQCDIYRKHGLPAGSSVVESACKHIFGNRFKTAGCRWSKAGATAPLAIRSCLENIRWPDFLE